MESYVKKLETQHHDTGMVYRYKKVEGSFIHTFCDGELVYKLGLSPEEVYGKQLIDFYPPEYVEEKTSFYEVAWAGEYVEYESSVFGLNLIGSLRPIFQNGKVIEVLGTCINISDRRTFEEKCTFNENVSRTVLETLSEGILLIEKGTSDENIKITTLNGNVSESFGITTGYYDESSLNNSLIKEDGTVLSLWELPGVVTQRFGTCFKDFIIGRKHPNGTVSWFTVNSKPLKLSNKDEIIGLVSFEDITLQKEQEIKLVESFSLQKTLLDNLNSGIAVINHDSEIAHINNVLLAILGLEENTNLIGKSTSELHMLYNLPNNIISFLEKSRNQSKEMVLKDGKILECYSRPVKSRDTFSGTIYEFIDITDRKRMEHSILQAKEEAERANMAKSDFLSKISHELRTPLNGILGFAQLLELEQNLSDVQLDFVQEILNSGCHLLNLINEILDLSRIESGNMRLILEEVDFESVLIESINCVQPLAKKKKISIHNHITPASKARVSADPIRLKQICINLLDNAIKYNHENGEVHVDCNLVQDNLQFCIRDTGLGISKSELERIFAPFYRIDSSIAQGTGIGLTLVEQLITLMEGKIEVTSTEGVGSKFSINLPLHTKTFKKADVVVPSQKADNITSLVREYTILYIEDNDSNRQLVSTIFSREQMFTLITAETGYEGLNLLDEQHVDLVLLDINLPDISGHEVYRKIKDNPNTREIPVIALSANAMLQDRQLALSMGFTDYVTKPIDVQQLLSTLYKNL